MAALLKRNMTSVEALQPGEYYVEHTRHTPNAMVGIAVACPLCGGISALTDDHTIERSGLVTPIWSCPIPRCSVMDWLDLGPEFGAKP